MLGIWFRRLFSTPLKPAGQPNFQSAPEQQFDLSGTKLIFRNPPQTTAVPRKIWPESLNLYTPSRFNEWPDGKGSTTTLFENGWSYFDQPWGFGDIGGIAVQIIIQRLTPKYREIDSLFKKQEAIKLILNNSEEFRGTQNQQLMDDYELRRKEMPFLEPPTLVVYPKTDDDLVEFRVNNHFWLVSQESGGIKGSWTRDYHLPIGDRHMLVISMRATSYGEFYSDKHNVPQECEKTVKAFMENVHVELSDEAKRQKEEALRRLDHH
ncbi:hypothetical protein [Endozoicomonas numazuensis]|uniref:Uncharacterized protein n=1 Tax=Endozoicomonas numazuensis TaxID=1137799 RepID=A0A081NIF4_9GAMM|nr:hypothetical protein [Endozoicomonas numazuensis]KEQ18227.1 hypothetical protein GZ78_11900 [Endozoicomonas numazuensis]